MDIHIYDVYKCEWQPLKLYSAKSVYLYDWFCIIPCSKPSDAFPSQSESNKVESPMYAEYINNSNKLIM